MVYGPAGFASRFDKFSLRIGSKSTEQNDLGADPGPRWWVVRIRGAGGWGPGGVKYSAKFSRPQAAKKIYKALCSRLAIFRQSRLCFAFSLRFSSRFRCLAVYYYKALFKVSGGIIRRFLRCLAKTFHKARKDRDVRRLLASQKNEDRVP